MRILKSVSLLLGMIFACGSVLLARTPSAQASTVLSNLYTTGIIASSTISSTARQLRIDPVSGSDALYVLGLSATTLGNLSADGSSFTAITYSPSLPTHTSADMFVTNGKVYISETGSSPAVYRYDIDGSTSNLFASATLPSGITSVGYNKDTNIVYVTKGDVIYSFEQDLSRTTPTTTLVSTPARLSYGGNRLHYMASNGSIRRATLDGSSTLTNGVNDILLASSGVTSSNIKGFVTSDDGSAIYYGSNTGIFKRSADTGSLIWSIALPGITSMEVHPDSGKIFVANSGGTAMVYNPINPVTSASATASSTSAILNWTTGISDTDFSGTTVVRSTAGYPTSVTDGTIVTSTSAVTTFTDAGLSEGVYYYSFFNETLDGYYSVGVTSTVTINLPPEAPVLVTSATGTTASLTWTTPADTASFLLRRSTDDFPTGISDGTTVTSTDSSVTSYTDEGLSDNTYYYGLFAADAEGNYSSVATSSIVIDTTGPEAPIISAAIDGNNIHLTWDVPATTESFLLQRSDGVSTVTVTTTVSSVTGFTQNDLTDGTYQYSLYAIDAHANTSAAGLTTSLTVDTIAPSAPTGFSATASGSNAALSWSNPILDFSSVTLRRSNLTYPLTLLAGTAVTSSFTGTTFIDSGLVDGSYFYGIFALDAFGNISVAATASTTIDAVSPALSVVTSTVSSDDVTVTWETDEAASSQVVYGINGTSSSTARFDEETGVTSHEVTLSSLRVCTTYQYRVVSTDQAGNTSTSTAQTFTTEGCPGGATVVDATSTTIVVGEAGHGEITTDRGTLSVDTGIGFTSAPSNTVLQMQSLDATTVLAGIGRPGSAILSAGSFAFEVSLFDEVGGGAIESDFETPVRITYVYDPEDVAGLDLSTLRLYHYHDESWYELDDCEIDTTEHTVSCTTPSFSIFALFGRAPTPTTRSSSGGGGVGGGGGGGIVSYILPSPSQRTTPISATPTAVTITPTTSAPSPVAKPQLVKTPSTQPAFARTLKVGVKGADVKALQIFLNTRGFTVAAKGLGSKGKESDTFGPATAAALKRFQERYADQVLKPYGLKKGTGVFGASTMKLVNEMK